MGQSGTVTWFDFSCAAGGPGEHKDYDLAMRLYRWLRDDANIYNVDWLPSDDTFSFGEVDVEPIVEFTLESLLSLVFCREKFLFLTSQPVISREGGNFLIRVVTPNCQICRSRMAKRETEFECAKCARS